MSTREILYEEKRSSSNFLRVLTEVSQGATGNVNYLTAVNDGINHLISDLSLIEFCTANS